MVILWVLYSEPGAQHIKKGAFNKSFFWNIESWTKHGLKWQRYTFNSIKGITIIRMSEESHLDIFFSFILEAGLDPELFQALGGIWTHNRQMSFVASVAAS